MMRRLLVAAGAAGAVGVALVLAASPASAHPLGNFTTNTYAGLQVAPQTTAVDYVLDLAEVPALAAIGDIDVDGDDQVDAAEGLSYRSTQCAALAGGVALEVGGEPVALEVGPSSLRFPPGEAGLDTLRLECRLVADAGAADGPNITLADDNLRGRVGWHEVTAVGDRATLIESDVPTESASRRLTRYPDELRSPFDQRRAAVRARPGGPALGDDGGDAGGGSVVRGGDRFTTAFTSLVADHDLTPLFALAAFAIALALGALHAVQPGHGKTLMAAYVVGREGTVRQLSAIGATVAATHTAGVLVLGVVVTASSAFAPERFLRWASVASGLLLAGVGAGLLRRRLRSPHGHRHPHGHGPGHSHGHGHGHGGGHDHPRPVLPRPLAPGGPGGVAVLERPATVVEHDHPPVVADHGRSWRSIMAMGFAGGMVPSPSALIVLLGAVALGRAWFGVVLVLGYGIGMAATLVAAGLLLLRARARIERWSTGTGWLAVATAALPWVTAVALILGGLSISLRALV